MGSVFDFGWEVIRNHSDEQQCQNLKKNETVRAVKTLPHLSDSLPSSECKLKYFMQGIET